MEEKDKTADLLKKIISKMQKKKEQESRIENNTIMVKPAKVIDSNGQNVNIYFLDDKNQTIYTLHNKTGETLNENDDVKVYYTSNPAKGWVGMKCGESLVETSSTGVGRPSEWDETSEYFNYYDNREQVTDDKAICNVAGDPNMTGSYFAHASGYNAKATGHCSIAMGYNVVASGAGCVSIGRENKTGNYCAVAIGYYLNVNGASSAAFGTNHTISNSYASFIAGGMYNQISGGSFNYVENDSNNIISSYSCHAEGHNNKISGGASYCHVEGHYCSVSAGYGSHVNGVSNDVENPSHGTMITGYDNKAVDFDASFLGGRSNNCESRCTDSFIFGFCNKASVTQSFVTGGNNTVSGYEVNVIGNYNTITKGNQLIVIGNNNNIENGYNSIIMGNGNKELNAPLKTTFCCGQYNSPIDGLIFTLGNGSGDDDRSNAFAVDKDGNVFCKSISCSGSTDVTGSLRDTHIDFANTSFVDAFAWDETTYPNTTDPSLEGKPVLVIALTDGGEISYKFIDLSFLTTTSISQQTNNHIKYLSDGLFVNVNENIDISEQDKNLIEQKDDGLYVTLPISAESDNILEQKDDGYYVQKHQDNKKPIESYEYTSDTQITCNGITYSITKDESTGLISQVMDSEGNTLNPTINGNVTDVSFQNAVLMAMVMQNGLKSMN